MALSTVKTKVHEFLNTEYHQQMLADAKTKREEKLALERALVGWLQTSLGAAFNSLIQKKRSHSLELLAKADPTDTAYIQKLQNEIAQCSTFNQFCARIALDASTLKQ
jgi:hypothetical protein